ncbi:type II secretion system protein [bacterium]|nr:type II secretion system protein [bacterium]
MRNFKQGFTLAEVLITLAVIGVVAALTLPTLIANINTKVETNQKKVTEAKLIQGLNMLDLHGGINNTYSSTAEFVEELSKYMKITKICDGTNSAFTECIPYNEVKYTDSDNEEQTVDVVDLNTAASLGKGNTESGEEFMAPVAMVLADGTPIILTYNKNCISDPDSIKNDNKNIHKCVAGIYDLNGSRTPNKYGKDLTAFNGGTINIVAAEGGGGGGSTTQAATIKTIAGYRIIKQVDYPSAKNCENYIGNSKYPDITHCPYGSREEDYWVGAVVACRDLGGHLPNMEELSEIAKKVYPARQIVTYGGGTCDRWDTSVISDLGIDPSSVSYFSLWSSEEDDMEVGSDAYRYRSFSEYYSDGGSTQNSYESSYQFICLEGEY